MNVRFISKPTAWPALLTVLVLPLWAGVAHAQTPAPPAPAATTTQAAPAAFRSALEGYQPYTDEKIVSWKEANDNVGRIGGWREYAKEAAQAAPGPQTPGAVAKPGPPAAPTKP